MDEVKNIPTRFAIVKRAEKILKEIDDYFQDADDFGLTVAEADPKGEMMACRKGILGMLEREGWLKKKGLIK